MKIKILLLVLAPFALGGCVHKTVPVTPTTEVTTTGEMVVMQAPPAVRIETQTVSPGPTYVWTKGHWSWVGGRYQWVAGTWVARPGPASVWVDGHWLRHGSGWVWIAGRWQ